MMCNTLALLTELISRKSVTPEDAGCQDLLTQRLEKIDFKAEQLIFEDTKNLWLKRGNNNPLFVFLGHTDVVPAGHLEQWDSPPFEPVIRNNRIYGRGAADMKGGIACFVTAVERFIASYPNHQGAIAMLMTSDEEGTATNGTVKVVKILEQRNEKIDWCLVGEPSSNQCLGDMIRVGRRGSLCAKLVVKGVQGHVAYPATAYNPIHGFAPALRALTEEVWDQGNQFFPPTSLQISNIKGGTGVENIIPGKLELLFNLRFCTESDEVTIKRRVLEIFDRFDFDYEISWRLSGNPFLTSGGALIEATQVAIKKVTGVNALNDTGGGTSDGRFIAPTGAQVIELGHLNASIHKINENIPIADLQSLSAIYEQLLIELFITN